MSMERQGIVPATLLLTGSLFIWATHFGVIYLINTLACTRSFWRVDFNGFGIVPLVVILATLFAIAGACAILAKEVIRLRAGPEQGKAGPAEHFLAISTIGIATVSIVAIFWNAVPAFIVPPCG